MLYVRRRVLTWFLILTVSVVFVYTYIYILLFNSIRVQQVHNKHHYVTMVCYVKGISAGDKYQDTIYKIFISHFHSLYISYTNTLTTYVDIFVEMGGAT